MICRGNNPKQASTRLFHDPKHSYKLEQPRFLKAPYHTRDKPTSYQTNKPHPDKTQYIK